MITRDRLGFLMTDMAILGSLNVPSIVAILLSMPREDHQNENIVTTMVTSNDRYTEAVRDAATRFRGALDQGDLRLRSLNDFPKGSCGDASELLGQYLSDSGLGTWNYRSGTQSDPFVSHAWVERHLLIVDITANQFDDVSEPVLLTTDRTWHDSRFPSGPSRKIASLAWFQSNDNKADALADYDTLKRRADAVR